MKRKPPDRRTVERVMLAANRVTCDNDREAAIMGAIVHTLCETGQMIPHMIAQTAADSMGWAFTVARDIDMSIDEQGYAGLVIPPLYERMFPQSLRGYPQMHEITAMTAKFRDEYDPPTVNA